MQSGAAAFPQASRPAVDDFAFAEAFGSADNNTSVMFDDGFGGTSASMATSSQRATKQLKADFVSPDFAAFEEGDEQSPEGAFAFEEDVGGNGQEANGQNLGATVVIKDQAQAAAPATAAPVSFDPLPEPGSLAFDAATPAIQLRAAIQHGMLPPHTTLQEYLSLRGETGDARPISPAKAASGPAGSSFMDDFVGGTGSFDAERMVVDEFSLAAQSEAQEEGGQQEHRRGSLKLRQATETDADAAAVRIQAAIRGRQARKSVHDTPSGVQAHADKESGFNSDTQTADMAFDSFDAPSGGVPLDDFTLSPENRQGSGPVSAPTTHDVGGEDGFGFDAAPQARKATPVKPVGASSASTATSLSKTAAAAPVAVDDFDLPPATAAADFGFDSPSAPAATPAKSVPTSAPATLARSTSNAVATSASGESFEDFGFGSGAPTPAKPEAKVEAPVALPPVMLTPAMKSSSPPTATVPVLSALTSSEAISRGPLSTPSAPQLREAALGSLYFTWPPVEGADGYYLDVQSQASTQGNASRAVLNGSCLLPSPTGSVHGLMKDSAYVARVIAVRAVPVSVQGGKGMTVMEESEPSGWCDTVRTLNPAAEIVRLTASNRALQVQVDTLPAINAAMQAQGQELQAVQARLEAAKAEIVRLTNALNAKIADCNAAQQEIASLQGAIADRDASLAGETSEVLRLAGELADCQADLAQARAKINDLDRDVQDRNASLAAGEARESDLKAKLLAKEESLKAAQTKCEALEGQLKAEKQAEAELATKLNSTADKVSVHCAAAQYSHRCLPRSHVITSPSTVLPPARAAGTPGYGQGRDHSQAE